jgi:hypothetical protein
VPLLLPEASAFCLDFHPIPYRGDPTGLDTHYIAQRGKAGTNVLTFFAYELLSRLLCYANASLARADQAGELMRFIEFWHTIAGRDPQWLYFDSKLAPYPELSRVRIPVIPAAQSGAKLPPHPKEACHPIRTKAAPHRSPIGAQRRLGCSG